ncbi:hypothetical protein Btru_073086 [Bulinus truncatus]|nr:hypothetical protein Btru_073086 [Bulinus truncatus]
MAIPDDNYRGVQTSDDIVNDIALGPPTGLQETNMIEQLDVELRTNDTSLISHAQTDIAGISTNNALIITPNWDRAINITVKCKMEKVSKFISLRGCYETK